MENLQEIIDRVTAGSREETDIQEILRGFEKGEIVLSNGPKIVGIDGNVKDSQVVSGDGNITGDGNIIIVNSDLAQTIPTLNNRLGAFIDDLSSEDKQEITPYRGLEPFEEEQANFFFGRAEVVTQIKQVIEKSNFVAVIGSSGSGKSSVMQAGLIPWLRRQSGWQILPILKPDLLPLQALTLLLKKCSPEIDSDELSRWIEYGSDSLQKIAENLSGTDRYFLLIDQFEEIFTLSCDGYSQRECEANRNRFIDLLAQVNANKKSRLVIGITLRADFLGQYLRHDGLASLLPNNGVYLSPLRGENLKSAITKPAREFRCKFEEATVISLIEYMAQASEGLPLLQFALWKLWQEKGSSQILSHAKYLAMGGVTGALNQHADNVYNEFPPQQQDWIKRIFLELVQISEFGNDTRQRKKKQDLFYIARNDEERKKLKRLIDKLVKKRLLVTDGDSDQAWIDLTHESLMQEWIRFTQWRMQDRDLVYLAKRLRDYFRDWEQHGKKESFLLPEALLFQAETLGERLKPYRPEPEFQDFYQKSFEYHKKVELMRAEQLRSKALHIQDALQSPKAIEALGEIFQLVAQNLEQRLSENLPSILQDTLYQALETSREKNCLPKQDGMVKCVAFSPDGDLIATSSSDKTIRLWNSQGDSVRDAFRGHTESVWSIAFSPTNKNLLASGSADKTIRLWNLQGEPIGEPFQGHTDWIRSIAFSPNGKQIVSCSKDHTLKLWNLAGEIIQEFTGHTDWVLSVAFSLDGKFIVSGSADRTVRVWDLKGNLLLPPLEGHQGWVRSVAISPDSQYIVSGSEDKTLCLWTRENNSRGLPIQFSRVDHSFEGHTDKVLSVSFSPKSGKLIASGSADHTVRVWDLTGSTIGEVFNGHEDWIRSVRISPDGQSLVSGSRDKTIRLWDLQGSALVNPLQDHEERILSVAISTDSKFAISAGQDKKIRLWDLEDQYLVNSFEIHDDWIRSVKFSSNGDFIFSGGEDHKVYQMRRTDGEIIEIFDAHTEWVRSIAISSNDQYLASASDDKTICVWNINDGSLIQRLEGHHKSVLAVAFSTAVPDENVYIVSGSADQTVRVWDLNGEIMGNPFKGHDARVLTVAISPDNQFIVSGSQDRTLRLWKFDGTPIGKPFQGHEESIRSVKFSPDGQFIISGSEDHTIRLWDLHGKPIGKPLRGHQDKVRSVQVSSDGQMIISGSEDSTVRLWRLGTWKDWLKICCDRVEEHPYFKGTSSEDLRLALETCRKYAQKSPL